MAIRPLRLASVLTLALTLVACGQPPTPAAPTASAATTAPAPTAAVTTPTEAPAVTGVLPAPLLFISDENDIARLEVDGTTKQPLIPAGEPIDQALSPQELTDGIYVLVAESAGGFTQQFMPQRIASDGTVSALLPQPIEAGYDGGLWAPDGSGVIVGRPTASANRTIVWQPLGIGQAGEPAELLSGSIGKLAWASQ